MNLDQLNDNKSSDHRTELLCGVEKEFEAGEKSGLF
jgi:hypothetical protein